jgi:hypothetical protein
VEHSEITPPTSIRIGKTPHGRGVIATEDIAEEDVIEICPILTLATGDASGLLDDYVVGLEGDAGGVVLMLGYGGLYNHSDDPNAAYWVEAEDAYSFVALRDIEAGEEITISYGEEWLAARGGFAD